MLFAHLTVLTLTLIVVALADHEAFAYFRGKKQTLNIKHLEWFHRLVWAGLLLMIGTGLILFYPSRNYLLADTMFYVKMSFVALLVINASIIGKLINVAAEKPFSALTKKEKIGLMLSGAASTIGWFGAILGGFFLFG